MIHSESMIFFRLNRVPSRTFLERFRYGILLVTWTEMMASKVKNKKRRSVMQRAHNGISNLLARRWQRAANRPKDSHQLTSPGYYGWRASMTRAWRGRVQGGERRVGEKKKYVLVAEMPGARRIPLNWNALLCLSDFGWISEEMGV